MIISNTFGVLEIIYLFFFKAKDPWKNNFKNKFSYIQNMSQSHPAAHKNMTNANFKNKIKIKTYKNKQS